MVKWRSARLRRLYGKPTDPIENSDDASAGPESAGQSRAASEAPPAPPPKRVRREKTRPESEYELIHHMPVTPTPPDYSLLVNPLTEKQADTVAYAVHASRQNWLSGSIFETFWTRKPRGKKATDNQPNLREKMTKLHECAISLGPHTFPVKLFTVKDDNAHLDDEEDRKIEAQLAAAEKERQQKVEVDKPAVPDENDGQVKKELGENEQLNPPTNAVKSANTDEPDADGHSEAKNTPEAAQSQIQIRAVNSPHPEEPHAETPLEKSNLIGADNEVASTQDLKTPEVGDDDAGESTGGEASSSTNPTRTESKIELSASKPPAQSDADVGQSGPALGNEHHIGLSEPAAEQSQSELSSPNVKSTKTRRRGRPRSAPVKPVNAAPFSDVADQDNFGRKQSFEMERQNLEAEKRRVEELEKRLSGQSSSGSTTTDGAEGQAAGETGAKGQTAGETEASATPARTDTAPPEPPNAPPVTFDSAPRPLAGSTPDQSDPRNVPPAFVQPPKAVPNELVVSKLQQMAARDPTLGELMRVVASQTASHEDIMKFQEIINRVKASIFSVPNYAPKAKAKPKPRATPQVHRVPPTQPLYQARASSKAIMLAIEFDENPTERHLLPKRSILEYIPIQGQLLWSFLHVSEDVSKKASTKVYTPVTATFHDIPPKVAQTLERCVRKPEVVAHYMKETMANAVRSEPWFLWFRIEKNDEVLLESIKKSQAPTMAPPPAPRKPMKPRKVRAQPANYSANVAANIRRLGEPLVQSYPMIIGRRGQPMVQPPSYYRHIYARSRGPQIPRNGPIPGSQNLGTFVPGMTTGTHMQRPAEATMMAGTSSVGANGPTLNHSQAQVNGAPAAPLES